MAGTPNRRVDVSALVSAFNVSHPNSLQGQNVNLGQSRYARHGIAELSRSARNRSRDREPRGTSAPITMVRGQPSGPMEATEWTDALADINARISTMERQQAAHGQFMARMDTRANDHRSVSQEVSEDIHKYKQYVQNVFSNIDAALTSGMKKLQDEYNVNFTSVADVLGRMQADMIQLQALATPLPAESNQDREPQRYDMTGGPGTEPWDAWQEGRDRMGLPNQQPLRRQLPPAHLPGQPLIDEPQAERRRAPQMPHSFAPEDLVQSPFDNNDPNFHTPPARPSLISPELNGAPGAAPLHPGYVNPRMQGQVYGSHQPKSFEIAKKCDESLYKFNGDSSKYKIWNDRMKDHLAGTNLCWVDILEKLEVCTQPITRNWLINEGIHGENAWELSQMMSLFICKWLDNQLYGSRQRLAGGRDEKGNGFEIWRKLFQEHHGNADILQVGGVRRLKEWPRCTNHQKLKQHLADWEECLEVHNVELMNAPNTLRTMLLDVIPADYEDEILIRPEVRTYKDIVMFCNRRSEHKRAKQLAEAVRRPGGTGGSIHALTSDNDQPPAWALKMFSQQQAPDVQPPPAAHAASRQPRLQPEISAMQQARRPLTTNGRKAFNMKFRFAGCWHCADPNHSRKANAEKGIKGCPKFELLKSKNGGKPPAGYKGAYEKARDEAWDKFRKANPKVNSLETDDSDLEDSESEFEHDGICALTTGRAPSNDFTHPNAFADLADEEDDLSDDFIKQFQGWAGTNNVRVAPTKVKSAPLMSENIHIASLKELDDKMHSDQRLTALPTNTKKLQRAIRKLSAINFDLADDEVLALVDTGSSIHAADADLHFGEYASHVRKPKGASITNAATTAGGHRLENLGKFVVNATTNGQDIKIPFNHMKVKLPILSVRQMLNKGGQLSLHEAGGSITNPNAGQTINFIVHEGLWYMKLKVGRPSKPMPFGRQGKA